MTADQITQWQTLAISVIGALVTVAGVAVPAFFKIRALIEANKALSAHNKVQDAAIAEHESKLIAIEEHPALSVPPLVPDPPQPPAPKP